MKTWKDRIVNMEVSPPGGAWENINERLDTDEQEWAGRVRNTSVTPPAAAWDNITEKLGAGSYEWASRVREMNVAPPAAAWDNIENTLHPVKVIPVYRQYVRYAVAAVAIGTVATLTFFLLQKNEPKKEIAQVPATNTQVVKSDDAVTVKEEDAARSVTAIAATDNNTDAVPVEVSSNTGTQNIQPRPVNSSLLAKNINRRSVPLQTSLRNDLVSNDQYTVVTNFNGSTVKVSNKLCSAIQYLDNNHGCDESYIDKFLRESDSWKITFKLWRDKMLNAASIPSADNFLDIVDLAKTISEE